MIKQVFLSDQKYFSPQKKSNGSFIFCFQDSNMWTMYVDIFAGYKQVETILKFNCCLWNVFISCTYRIIKIFLSQSLFFFTSLKIKSDFCTTIKQGLISKKQTVVSGLQLDKYKERGRVWAKTLLRKSCGGLFLLKQKIFKKIAWI